MLGRVLVASCIGAAAVATVLGSWAVTRHHRSAAAPALPPSVHPWPIGPTPEYRPTPTNEAVAAGTPIGGLRCGTGATFQVHVELFAHRRAIVIPARIGVSRLGCRYPLHTETPTGVVEVESSRPHRLRDLFAVWGRTLSSTRLLTFRGDVEVFVSGRRYDGDPGSVPLTEHAQIVVELGGFVPPHPTFLFPVG